MVVDNAIMSKGWCVRPSASSSIFLVHVQGECRVMPQLECYNGEATTKKYNDDPCQLVLCC